MVSAKLQCLQGLQEIVTLVFCTLYVNNSRLLKSITLAFQNPLNPKTMKALKLIIVAAIILLATNAKNIVTYDVKASTGEVNQIEGLYIFTDSRPVKETEFLGSEKAGVTWSGSYSQIINKIAKKARKEYPTAQAIIFNGEEKADIVKFK